MTCPNCQQAMTEHVLAGHLGTSVTIDVCTTCQAFWFDDRESLQLAPASTLRLFRLIGETKSEGTAASFGATIRCPRCALTLRRVHDMQRRTRFEYQRCPREHGRFITFFNFLREKNFLTPMTPAQLEELRRSVSTVNCRNCGGAIDLASTSQCEHCGSALSLLDLQQAERLVTELRQADTTGRPVDPTLPLRLEQARRDVELALAGTEANSASGLPGDPLLDGLRALARWLGQRV